MNKLLEIYVDGASRGNPGPSGVGIFIKDDKGKELVKRGEFIGECTNNVAEYEALKRALKLVLKDKALKADTLVLRVHTDSELVVKQLTGCYKIKSQNLMSLVIEARNLMKKFKAIEFKQIPRKDNKIADTLANKSMNLKDDVDDLKVTVL
ncbi:MAG: ribonuclease HI family protein [Planctomycetes bacterium]|nr:ribonuclease HI family protein [Planctomycetota bacterium]